MKAEMQNGRRCQNARITSSPYFVYVLVSPLFLILLAYVIYPFV